MTRLVFSMALTFCLMWAASTEDSSKNIDSPANITHPDKDMYIIHATVYQVGILTNRTDNMTDNYNSTGNQESVTLFHTNGTNVDLSAIPEPFMTNVTAQSIVGVAPVLDANRNVSLSPAWSSFSQLANPAALHLGNVNVPAVEDNPESETKKRSLDNYFLRLFKRDTMGNTPVKVVNGAAVIPPEVGLQSISLPPLLSLNNNMSEIPVPIPNTSVIRYAKVNTLVQSH